MRKRRENDFAVVGVGLSDEDAAWDACVVFQGAWDRVLVPLDSGLLLMCTMGDSRGCLQCLVS